MNNQIKNERGITLIMLVVIVILLMIITTALAGNGYQSLQFSNLTKLENDIDMLNDRIAVYYVENGELPLLGNAVDISNYDITDVSRK